MNSKEEIISLQEENRKLKTILIAIAFVSPASRFHVFDKTMETINATARLEVIQDPLNVRTTYIYRRE